MVRLTQLRAFVLFTALFPLPQQPHPDTSAAVPTSFVSCSNWVLRDWIPCAGSPKLKTRAERPVGTDIRDSCFQESFCCFRRNFWPQGQSDVSLVDQLQVGQKAGLTGQLPWALLCRTRSFAAWIAVIWLGSKGLVRAQQGGRDLRLVHYL